MYGLASCNWRGDKVHWNAFKDKIKQFPGVRFNPNTKTWFLPEELVKKAYQLASDNKVELFVSAQRAIAGVPTLSMLDGLYPYQGAGVIRALMEARHIFNFEMGLGKTATAIRSINTLNPVGIIIAPAGVLYTWEEEINKWVPGGWNEGIIRYGRERKNLTKKQETDNDFAYDQANVKIVSYGLLEHIVPQQVDFIIVDEAHRIKNFGAKQSLLVRELIKGCEEYNPKMQVLALTGTMMPNEPKDIWNLLDTLWPTRFGYSKDLPEVPERIPYSFLDRYTNKSAVVDNETGEKYGTVWTGVNPAYADELNERIAAVSTRVTKAEVAHLLPPVITQLRRIYVEKPPHVQVFADWESAQEQLCGYSEKKLSALQELVEEAMASGVKHICILTHLRKTTEQIAQLLANRLAIPTTTITGEDSVAQRLALIDSTLAHERGIIVATMHSVEEGINNLANVPLAVFAELYFRPKTMLQVAGRFNRLSSKGSSQIVLMCLAGTIDEKIAEVVKAKMDAINKLVKAGQIDESLVQALNTLPSDEEFLKSCMAALPEEELY